MVAVAMTAEVTVHVFGTHHLTFDAGADVHLWGPEFSGTANVHVKVLIFNVSFHVAFGDHATLPEAIFWDAFKKAFLPDKKAFLPDQLCGVGLQGGLVRSIQDSSAPERWIVDPKHMLLTVISAVPITTSAHDTGTVRPRLGISPMAIEQGMFESSLKITIRDEAGKDVTGKFAFAPVTKAVPAALWGKPKVKEAHGKRFVDPPDVNGAGLIGGTLAGFTIGPKDAVTEGSNRNKSLQHGTSGYVADAFAWKAFTPDALKEPSRTTGTFDRQARAEMLMALGFRSGPGIATQVAAA
jgi:hypothetical protein